MGDTYAFDIDAYCTVCDRVIAHAPVPPAAAAAPAPASASSGSRRDSATLATSSAGRAAFAPRSAGLSSTSAKSNELHPGGAGAAPVAGTKMRRTSSGTNKAAAAAAATSGLKRNKSLHKVHHGHHHAHHPPPTAAARRKNGSHSNVAALATKPPPKSSSRNLVREEIIEILDDDELAEPVVTGLYCSEECRLIDEARNDLVLSSLGASASPVPAPAFSRRRSSTATTSTAASAMSGISTRFSPSILSPIPSAAPSASIGQFDAAANSAFPFPDVATSVPLGGLDFGARRSSTRAYRPTLIERASSTSVVQSPGADGSRSPTAARTPISESAPPARPLNARRTSSPARRRRAPPPDSRFFIGSAPARPTYLPPPTSSRARSSASLALLGSSPLDARSPWLSPSTSVSGFVAHGEMITANASVSTAATVTLACSPSTPSSYAPSVFSQRSSACTGSSDRLSSASVAGKRHPSTQGLAMTSSVADFAGAMGEPPPLGQVQVQEPPPPPRTGQAGKPGKKRLFFLGE
ncbi:hypothetical protein JCM8202_003146 [Rhodotorula sphaerocarpa]